MSDPAASEDKDDPEVVRDKWNETFKERVSTQVRRFSWHSSVIQRFMRDEWLDGTSVTGVLQKHLDGKTIRHGLDIGGGLGNQARHMLQLLGAERFDVVDISTYAVDQGNLRARSEGLNMVYSVADLNHEPLPDGPYDLIIVSGALHHIENLEHLFSEVARTLAPDGLFFANDYMGPNHMQWTEKQLALMNAIVALLPDEQNVVAHRQNQVIREVTRIKLENFAKNDPSEGVRASDIFEVMEKHLKIDRVVPFGQTLIYEVLRGRIQNFDDDDPKDRAILGLMALLEKELIEGDVIQSDFNLVLASRPS